MSSRKIEINLLGLAGAALLVASFFFPWWGFFTNNNTESFLYPHIIKGPVIGMIGYDRSPQMVLLTAGLAVSILLALLGSFLKRLPAKICLLLSSLITAFFLWRFIYRLSEITESYNIPLVGVGEAEYGGFFVAMATTGLKTGFYLAAVAAAVLIIAALIRLTVGFGASRSTRPANA